MEPIDKLLNQPGSLVRRSSAEIATSEVCSAVELLRRAGTPEWEIALIQLAQDKRHDLPDEAFTWWREKLSAYSDAEIRQALVLYAGEFFPSVDAIAAEIERVRLAVAERRSDVYWVEHERNNREIERFKAEHGGKTPQQVWVEENREMIAKIGGEEAALNAQRRSTASAQCMAEGTGTGDMGEKAGVSVEVHSDKPPRKSVDVGTSVSGDGQ